MEWLSLKNRSLVALTITVDYSTHVQVGQTPWHRPPAAAFNKSSSVPARSAVLWACLPNLMKRLPIKGSSPTRVSPTARSVPMSGSISLIADKNLETWYFRGSHSPPSGCLEYLQANIHEFSALRGLTKIQTEKRMPSGRRLDLVGRRARLNELVGIELKLGDINDRAVGQSLQYIDDLAKEGEQGLSAHYVLLAGGQANSAAHQRIQRHADACGVTLSVLLYSVEMTVRAHP